MRWSGDGFHKMIRKVEHPASRLFFKGAGILGIAFLSLVSGWVLFQSLGVEGSLMNSLAVMALFVSPLFLIYRDFARKGLLAVLVLTLPFNIDQTLFLRPHIGGAQGWIVSLNGLALVFLYLLLGMDVIREKKTDFSIFPRFGLPFLGLIVFAGLSLLAAPQRILGFFEWLELVKMYLIFITLYHLAKSGKDMRWILLFLLAGLGLESGIALMQKAAGSSLNLRILGGGTVDQFQAIGGGNVYRMGGTLGNSNSLAWYLDFILPIPLAILVFAKQRGIRMLALFCFLGGLATLLFTFSRGGWISFFAGAVIVVAFRLKNAPIIQKIYLGVIVLLALAILLTALFGVDNPIKKRFTEDDNRSAYIRIPLMQVAANMIRSNPFFGVGLNNYTLVDQDYDQTPERVTSHFPYPVHNLFFQLGAEIGVFGLASFLIFLFTAYAHNLRFVLSSSGLHQAVGAGILAGIIGAMIQGLVENCAIGSYHLLPLWALSGWMFGLSESFRKYPKESD
jgi:hypothetical protein